MARLIVRQDVGDTSAGRAVTRKSGYEEAKGLRDEMGVQDDEVFRSFDDGNDLTVTHDVTSPDAAKAFVADPHLAAVKELGVTGEPEIWIVDQT